MAKLFRVAVRNKIVSLFALAGVLVFAPVANAAFDKVTTYKDEKGWKLQVNGEDFYAKGVVWGYTPRGENYTYNLWGFPDDHVKRVLDHDFGLMAKAGVNSNRSFAVIPPKWVSYIYEKYGIMSVINPLMGRYGASIDGVWVPFTNYSDPRTREVLKAESLAIVEQYKDVPGVLMFAFGNESNYGLSWSSFEIEDLPVGEQNREKAKSLYSLWGEVIREGKEIAPDHLFTIVNGDIQYLDLAAEYAPEMDVFGTNVYRGISFGDLWKDVREGFDRPIIFMEFGSDAFNAKNFAEDQPAQANFLKGQWQEMYNQSYGNGGYGNSIGGYIFEWRDEWWKYKQTENLDIQDNTASWGNGGYTFDYVEGQNNMNEEWFGIMALGEADDQGVYEAVPRMAYDVMAEIWQTDPYSIGQASVNNMINEVNVDFYELKSDIRTMKATKKESDKFRLVGGNFTGEMLIKGRDNDLEESGENGLTFSDGQMLDLDFAFQPTNQIKGDFTINVLANVVNSDFEIRYGDRGLPITVEALETNAVSPDSTGTFQISRSDTELDGLERVEIYDFQATYTDQNYDLEAFYHVPRFHWMYEGDFYGLLTETTDMDGQDIWNAKAPYGVEFAGKKDLDGLKVVAGPEIYWGANPKAMIKYEFGKGDSWAFIHAEDIARREESSSATEATSRQSRQTTIYHKRNLPGGMKLELGAIMAATEKVDDEYTRLEGDEVVVDEIEFEDTLGAKAILSFPLLGTKSYVGLNYAGLVADGGTQLTEFGTELPYSGQGNKQVFEAGMQITTGDYQWYPRVFYRDNLVDANPNIEPSTSGANLTTGISARNTDSDPFAVLGNRQAAAAELMFTYDPTPATWFYHWDVDMQEDAAFAYNIGITGTSYKEDTDAYLFYFAEGDTNASFGEGLEAEDVFLIKSKMIFNPRRGLRAIANIHTGKKQSSGQPGQETLEFFAVDGKFIVDQKHIYKAKLAVDDFGPYDFQRQFNVVYPLQLNLGYARLLDSLGDEDDSSQWGVNLFYRTLDELSPADEYEDGDNDYMFEVQTYFTLQF